MSIKYKGKTVSGGSALPPGGTTGQVLTKASDADGNVEWKDAAGGGEVYSTEEIRIGTWIDGKPLYKKVMQVSCPITSGNVEVCSYDPSYDVKTIDVYTQRSDGYSKLPFVGAGTIYNTMFWLVNHTIRFEIGSGYLSFISGRPVTIIMEYTKTTD